MKGAANREPKSQPLLAAPKDSGAVSTPLDHISAAPESMCAASTHAQPDSGATARPSNQKGLSPESASSSPNQNATDSGAMVLFYADMVDDCERTRIAQQNRLRSLRQVKGIEEVTPEYVVMSDLVDTLSAVEKTAIKYLERHMRKHPLGSFVKKTVGLGMKQTARLLALIGDPAWHRIHERPRTLGELWAYCGLHVVGHGCDDNRKRGADNGGGPSNSLSNNQKRDEGRAPKRSKGVKANWSTPAKTRAILIATSCMKQRHSPFRKVYDDRRAHTKETHADWSDGHSHNDALRITAKAILKALWLESRGQTDLEAHQINAATSDAASATTRSTAHSSNAEAAS